MVAIYVPAKAKALPREGASALVMSLAVCMFRWVPSR
jgi:hypothetical protein